MAYSVKEWEVVKAFYERGLSLSEIVARDEVAIKDRSTISRRATAEKWVKGKKSTLLNKEIEAKQNLATVSDEKSTLNATEIEVHNLLVGERVGMVSAIQGLALRNAIKASALICETQQDHERLSNTILRTKEVVLGKDPDTVINNTNAQQTQTIDASKLSTAALKEIVAARNAIQQ